MTTEPVNYNPDVSMKDRQKVKLVFARWDYRVEFEEEVRGNCRGLTIVESAIETVCDQLPSAYPDDPSGPRSVVMKGPRGELEVVDDDELGTDWLNDMLLSAEIVSLECVEDD